MELKLKTALITEITAGDKAAYVEHFKEKEISDQTLNIPFPYGPKDADDWLHYLEEDLKSNGHASNWAIRRPDGFLIGGIGLHGWDPKQPHRTEIGYWLAKPYWGKGITTEAVKAVSEYTFTELKISRIVAYVFAYNQASARVLEKAGYHFEGKLIQHYQKKWTIF